MDSGNQGGGIATDGLLCNPSVADRSIIGAMPILEPAYWEVTILQLSGGASGSSPATGICTLPVTLAGTNNYLGTNSWGYFFDGANPYKLDTSPTSYGTAIAQNDVIGVTFDPDTGVLAFYLNGSSQGTAFTLSTSNTYFPWQNFGNDIQEVEFNFGQRTFAHTVPSGFSAIATQNFTSSHPLYVEGSAQLRAGIQINQTTFTGDDTGKADASFRQTWADANVVNTAWTRIRFLLEAHSSTNSVYDNLGVGIHSSGGSTVSTPVAVTVNGSASVTVPAGGKIWTDWIELTGASGEEPVLIADIASSGGSLRRLDGGSNIIYEKASTDSWNVADISALSFLSSSRTYLATEIEVQ